MSDPAHRQSGFLEQRLRPFDPPPDPAGQALPGLTAEQWRYAFTNTFSERSRPPCTSAITYPPTVASSGPVIQRSNHKHHKSAAITEIREYEGFAHLLPAQPGGERIAD